jgi:ribonuclease P protein component
VTNRVLKRKDFLQLNRESFFSGKFIHINYRPTRLPFLRLGITVTKKWANAVGRNLFKRRVKNSLQGHLNKIKFTDIQVKPKRGSKPTFSQIQNDLDTFFEKRS